ncbi:MAG: ankyrin repeat domain-containing protein, partial [Deltaproteobacteria bacterium]|nr:ankyrin repeat domain-containing protein [Deltaproteobacteria bacterium]
MRLVSLLIVITVILLYAPHAQSEEASQRLLARGCVTGNVDQIKEAIKNGANVNQKSANRTPLYFAVSENNLNAVILLVENGDRIDPLNGIAGRSALHQAAIKGYFDIVKHLVNAGAEINIRNTHNRTPLDYAIAARKAKVYDPDGHPKSPTHGHFKIPHL